MRLEYKNLITDLSSYPDSVINRVDKIEIPVDIPLIKGTGPIKDLTYLFVPSHRNNRLAIVHQGHACTFKDSRLGENGYRMEVTIKALLAEGYDVLAVFMPHITESYCNINHGIVINTYLGYKKHKATYGLRLFLEPTIVSFNYLLTQNSYDDISHPVRDVNTLRYSIAMMIVVSVNYNIILIDTICQT